VLNCRGQRQTSHAGKGSNKLEVAPNLGDLVVERTENNLRDHRHPTEMADEIHSAVWFEVGYDLIDDDPEGVGRFNAQTTLDLSWFSVGPTYASDIGPTPRINLGVGFKPVFEVAVDAGANLRPAHEWLLRKAFRSGEVTVFSRSV
jgi:hypothetical protein